MENNVPLVAPTAVAPGCITTMSIRSTSQNNEQESSVGQASSVTVKEEPSTNKTANIARKQPIASTSGQFKTLEEIRAAFPIENCFPNNNNSQNLIKANHTAIPDRMGPESKTVVTPAILTTSDNSRLLYDPPRRRGRPLDIPDQTIIAPPPPSGAKPSWKTW